MVTQKELVILHKGVKDGQVKKVQLCKAGVRALLGQSLQECEGGAPESPWRPDKPGGPAGISSTNVCVLQAQSK